MATFFPQAERSFLERLTIRTLKAGNIPEHIAFIMDGNRRYAQRINAERAIGHTRGFEKLAEALSWCRDLGIKQATVYAFSIENFKRSIDEVDCLLNLFRQQFAKLIEEFDRFVEHDICVRFFGKLELLPEDIRQSIAKIVLRTKNHRTFNLNVCLSYTAREEICNAINDIVRCVKSSKDAKVCLNDVKSDTAEDDELSLVNFDLSPGDINDHLLTEAMYSTGLRDPDILLRTSGEIRLSDFLLWQTSFSHVAFVDDLWPDLSIWSFFKVIIEYQLRDRELTNRRQEYELWLNKQDRSHAHNLFMEQNLDKGMNRFEDFLEERRRKQKKCIEMIRERRMNVHRSLLPEEDEDGLIH